LAKLLAKMKLRDQIIALVIAICAFSLVSMSIASYVTIQKLANYSATANIALGDSTTGSASNALMEQAHDFLMIIAQQQSKNYNSMLNKVKYNVELIDGVVTDIFNNPEYYKLGRKVVKPSEVIEGIYTVTYIMPESTRMTKDIWRELNLLSNLGLLLPTLTKNQEILEFYVGMESGLFCNYTQLIYEDPEYDPRVRPWYIEAVKRPGEVIFTEIYEDALGAGLVMTAAKAIYNKQGNLLGVAAIDISLKNKQELMLEMRIASSGYAFIINKEGKFIVHPDMNKEGFKSDIFANELDASIAEGYRRMMNGETGFVKVKEADNPFFMTFSPISVADWSVGVIVYENELLSVLNPFLTQMESLMNNTEKNIAGMSDKALITFGGIVVAVVVMVVLLAIVLTFVVSKPIQKLAEEVVKVGEGNLDKMIEGKYNDELDKIKKAVNSMAADIKIHLNEKLQAERAAYEAEIARLELVDKVNRDALTGLYNRRYLDKTLTSLLNTLCRSGSGALCVFMIDVDYFKKYNDTYGHAQGDECLKAVANAIRNCLARVDDFAVRYGGEEFIVILPNVVDPGTKILADRVLESVRSLKIPHKNSDVADYVTISIGAAFGKVTKATSQKYFIEQADSLLYESKQNGRNRCTFKRI